MSAIAPPEPASIQRKRARVQTSRLRQDIGLVRELAATQFKLKYTGSLLGYVWSLLKPLLLFGITYVIFAVILKVGGNDPTFPMQLLIAIVMWTFFADSIAISISSIASNGGIIRKASFPRWTLVAGATFSALLTFVINMLLIVAIALPLGRLHLGWSSFLAIPLMVELYLVILGTSLLLSSLFVFYRDVGHIWDIFSQLLFYGSMIVFPFAKVAKHSLLKSLIFVNPIAQIVEDTRHVIVAPVTAPWTVSIVGLWAYLLPFAVVVLAVGIGSLVFRALSPRFAEYL